MGRKKPNKKPKDGGFEEWMSPKKAEAALKKLCGIWHDTKGSSYTLSRGSERDLLDVATERPTGRVIFTAGLILVEWDSGWGRIVWGRGGPRAQFVLSSCSKCTLEWHGASSNFQWYREEDEYEDDEEEDWLEEDWLEEDWLEEECEPAVRSSASNMQPHDARYLLGDICGTWSDTKRNYYTVRKSYDPCRLNVITTRPSGFTRRTNGLIHIVWKGSGGQVVWGHGGPGRQYTIGSYDGWSLKWLGASSKFEWSREEEEEQGDEAYSSREEEEEQGDEEAPEEKDDVDEEEEEEDEVEVSDEPKRRAGRRRRRRSRRVEEPKETTEEDDFGETLRFLDKGRAASRTPSRSLERKWSLVNDSPAVGHNDIPQTPEPEDDNRQFAELETARVLDALKVDPSSPSKKDLKRKGKGKGKGYDQASLLSQPPGYFSSALFSPPHFDPSWPQFPIGPQSAKLSPEEVGVVAAQIGYWFSDANLATDTHLKSLMHDQGWVYLGTLETFNRMRQMGADVWAMRLALIPHQELEMDGTALYVRIRDAARREKWLKPVVQ